MRSAVDRDSHRERDTTREEGGREGERGKRGDGSEQWREIKTKGCGACPVPDIGGRGRKKPSLPNQRRAGE